jgi:hypothetical protein
MLLVLPAKIRVGRKCQFVTNILAYYPSRDVGFKGDAEGQQGPAAVCEGHPERAVRLLHLHVHHLLW